MGLVERLVNRTFRLCCVCYSLGPFYHSYPVAGSIRNRSRLNNLTMGIFMEKCAVPRSVTGHRWHTCIAETVAATPKSAEEPLPPLLPPPPPHTPRAAPHSGYSNERQASSRFSLLGNCDLGLMGVAGGGRRGRGIYSDE